MKKEVLKGPAIIRRRYKGDWEYARLLADDTYEPMGSFAPSKLEYAYQCTWENKVQKIVKLGSEDKYGKWQLVTVTSIAADTYERYVWVTYKKGYQKRAKINACYVYENTEKNKALIDEIETMKKAMDDLREKIDKTEKKMTPFVIKPEEMEED